MTSLRLFILNFFKNKLLENEKEDFKEVIQKRLIEDSKGLGLAAFVINVSSVALVISIPLLSFGLLNLFDVKFELAILYSVAITLFISILSLMLSFLYLRNKIQLYKNIATIKRSTTDFSWLLSPLMIELSHEHRKMKSNFIQYKMRPK